MLKHRDRIFLNNPGWLRFALLAALIAGCLSVCLPLESAFAARLYFIDNNAHSVNRMDLSGGEFRQVAQSEPVVLGFALDSTNQKMYWADNGSSSDPNGRARIYRADLNGSNREVLYESTLTAQGEVVYQLALDGANDQLYFTGRTSGDRYIDRINTDGSGRVSIVSGLSGLGTALELDSIDQRLLFQYAPGGVDAIGSSALDGTNITPIFQGRASSIFADPDSNRILVASFFDDALYQFDLTTSSYTQLSPARDTRDVIRFGDSIYYTAVTLEGSSPNHANVARIMRADLDGSNPISIYSVNRNDAPSAPFQLAIYVPEPQSLVGFLVGAVLLLVLPRGVFFARAKSCSVPANS